MRLRSRLQLVATLLGLLLLGSAAAQESTTYPTRPVRLIVPSQPGGVVDITARILGPALTELWKQSVIVETRAGGNGIIGLEAVAKAGPDGHTLLVGIGSDYTITPHFYAKFPLDPLTSFTPIALVTDNPLIITANANAPFNEVNGMIAYARAQTGGLAFSSPGSGSHNHLIGERFALETGVKMVHVAYKGGGPAGAAIASGEVQVGLIAAPSAMAHIKSGRAKAIAVTTARRIAIGPDWPTLAESGIPGFDASNWVAIAAPAGTPRDLIERLNSDFNRALRGAEVRERLSAAGSEIVESTPDSTAARMKDDSARYAKLVRQLGLKFD